MMVKTTLILGALIGESIEQGDDPVELIQMIMETSRPEPGIKQSTIHARARRKLAIQLKMQLPERLEVFP